MSDDLEKGLNDFLKEVERKTTFTVAEKSKITAAGAKAFAENLKEVTPRSDVDYGTTSGKKKSHLQDDITYEPGYNSAGLQTGTTAVGWKDKYNSLIARYVNNGTRDMSVKEIANLHFIERAQKSSKDAVLEANAKKLKEVMQHDHGS